MIMVVRQRSIYWNWKKGQKWMCVSDVHLIPINSHQSILLKILQVMWRWRNCFLVSVGNNSRVAKKAVHKNQLWLVNTPS